MSMTHRFALPLIHPGQAQKEMFHNEAIVTVDALLHPDVRGAGVNEPPAAPEPGESWIVGAMPLAEWAEHAEAIASWTDNGWRFSTPRPGMAVWVETLGQTVRYRIGSGWEVGTVNARRIEVDGIKVIGPREAAVALPTGGAIVDEQARIAIAAIVDALQAHGLIASAEL